MTPSTRPAAAIVALLLLVTACAGETSSPPADTGRPITPDAVVLRVDYTGGFVPATHILSRLPLISVYGDGRVITDGPMPEVYPRPAVPNVQQQTIAPEQVDALVQKALAAGVGTEADFGRPSVTDMPSTRFTVTTSEATRTLEVYALVADEDGMSDSLTAEQRAARKKLIDLLAGLQELSQALGEPGLYRPSVLAVITTPYTDQTEMPPPDEIAWPGPALPGQVPDANLRAGCVTVTGDEVAAVLALAVKANVLTPWTSGGKRWSLSFRPLLPDESGCANLFNQR
jgi:hypothetical protein